ncbi:hypothetical protein G7046_g2224 [Stylonectria norvegica]|nr:hypothetical protein G7046_g2224 [Stylonectria norvegica]
MVDSSLFRTIKSLDTLDSKTPRLFVGDRCATMIPTTHTFQNEPPAPIKREADQASSVIQDGFVKNRGTVAMVLPEGTTLTVSVVILAEDLVIYRGSKFECPGKNASEVGIEAAVEGNGTASVVGADAASGGTVHFCARLLTLLTDMSPPEFLQTSVQRLLFEQAMLLGNFFRVNSIRRTRQRGSITLFTFAVFKQLPTITGGEWRQYYTTFAWEAVSSRTSFFDPDRKPLFNVVALPSGANLELARL